jgi:hypothetical protein
MRHLALLLVVSVLVAGCRTTRAALPIERPALEVPPAPPRVVVTAPAPEVRQPEPVPDLPSPAPASATPARTRPAPAPPTAKDIQKPEQRPEEAESTAAAPAPPPPPPPPPLLRTPATADSAAAERQVRLTIGRVRDSLKGVQYGRLTPERKKAYGQATDFVESAEVQIKGSNFELAKEFADKAEKLARELQGR